ncbi:MAG TPA: glycerol-3-phosphate 1-O-acyltransferase PlsY [Vicinamibacterales bacterium]|nr:glycerol-3-phosphate 1-O-acyltransferase PlsY [Vicinamibacterales bacterium]
MLVLGIICAYLIGSIPFALLLARRWGHDLHRVGSGNIGAANVLRAAGVRAGVVVALLDIAKGAAGVMVAGRVTGTDHAGAIAGVAAVVGHIYPVWLRFRGGKGVATACGVFAMLAPLAVPPALLAFLAAVWASRYISVGSVAASLVLPPVAYVSGSSPMVVASACATAALIVFRHRSNLMRVRFGTERRVGARV